LIALKILQEFLEAVFIEVVRESLLSDEEVELARHEKRVIMAITFGVTIGSR